MLFPLGSAAAADAHRQMHEQMQMGGGAAPESRQFVEFPASLLQQELTHMRQHLVILGQLQADLSKGDYSEAATLAEQNLGMSSLSLHGAEQVAKYMPQGMREIGTAMHQAASRFAIAAANAGATGDVRPALAALSDVTRQCAACHTTYRLR